ncbi:MAG: hypothetical protein FWF90_06570 [Promicromonosporaceae bacterium]|nr:hypothetical protein [Promicromonosporaceae bacterium]
MTNRNDLTARYLDAAAGQVPEPQREALRLELAERIADTMDAKQSTGASAESAEYDTLTELGHPAKLAADYLDRPLVLIGPRYYLLWRKLVRLVVPIAAGVAAGGAAIGALADDKSAGAVIGELWSTGVQVAVFVAAGITVVFAVFERTVPDGEMDPGSAWRPELLPEITTPTARAVRRDRVAEAVWLVVLGVFVAVLRPYSASDGSRHWVLDGGTWQWLQWALLAIIAAELVMAIVTLARGRWTWTHAGVGLALNAATIAVLVPPLLRGRVFDPAALRALDWADGPAQLGQGGHVTAILVVAVVALCAWDAVKGFLRAAKQSPAAAR